MYVSTHTPHPLFPIQYNRPRRHRFPLFWKIQRIASYFIGSVILAVVVGLVGTGIFTDQVAQAAGSNFSVHYSMSGRDNAPTTLRMAISSESIQDGHVRISMDRDYIDRFDIQSITPEPKSVQVTPDRYIYTFAAEPTSKSLLITYRMTWNDFGWHTGNISYGSGHQSVHVRHFVYP
jgi:hypothetical protein